MLSCLSFMARTSYQSLFLPFHVPGRPWGARGGASGNDPFYLYATDPVSGDDRSPSRPQTHGDQLPPSTGALGVSARELLLPGVRAEELSRCPIPHLYRPSCRVVAALNQEEVEAGGRRIGSGEGERKENGGCFSWCMGLSTS